MIFTDGNGYPKLASISRAYRKRRKKSGQTKYDANLEKYLKITNLASCHTQIWPEKPGKEIPI